MWEFVEKETHFVLISPGTFVTLRWVKEASVLFFHFRWYFNSCYLTQLCIQRLEHSWFRCNFNQHLRIGMNIVVHSQTAVKHVHKKWHTTISGSRLTHIAFSCSFFSCYSSPPKNRHLLLHHLIWGQKVNQPGLEITSSVWRLFSTQIKFSVSSLCALTNSLTDTTKRAGLERNEWANAEWSLTWARPPPEVCMPSRCYFLFMLLHIQGLPTAHILQNLRGQRSGKCTLNMSISNCFTSTEDLNV